jgi:hypothetical protein
MFPLSVVFLITVVPELVGSPRYSNLKKADEIIMTHLPFYLFDPFIKVYISFMFLECYYSIMATKTKSI